jgi:hypothetical protein
VRPAIRFAIRSASSAETNAIIEKFGTSTKAKRSGDGARSGRSAARGS